jgi:hypothetical protein
MSPLKPWKSSGRIGLGQKEGEIPEEIGWQRPSLSS